VVDRADLPQPEVRQDEADVWHALLDKNYAERSHREHPDGMMAIAGRDGREEALLDVDGGDREGEGLPEVVQAERAQAASQNNEVVRARRRLGLDRDHQPRHRRPHQDAGGQPFSPYPSKGDRVHRLGADREGVEEQGQVRMFENSMQQARGSRGTSSRTAARSSTRRRTRSSINQGHGNRARRLLYNGPQAALKMTSRALPETAQAYTDAFNEVFGG
jgi:hypothetical protein